MIYFFNTPQRTDVALGCCSRSLVPMDGDGRVAVGRGVSLHCVGAVSPNFVVLTLGFVEKRGLCHVVFCLALP